MQPVKSSAICVLGARARPVAEAQYVAVNSNLLDQGELSDFLAEILRMSGFGRRSAYGVGLHFDAERTAAWTMVKDHAESKRLPRT
jgi:hypothetical protein